MPEPSVEPRLRAAPMFLQSSGEICSAHSGYFLPFSSWSAGYSSFQAPKNLLPRLAVNCMQPPLTSCFKLVLKDTKYVCIPQNRDGLKAPSYVFLPFLSAAAAARGIWIIPTTHQQEVSGSQTPQERQWGLCLPNPGSSYRGETEMSKQWEWGIYSPHPPPPSAMDLQ